MLAVLVDELESGARFADEQRTANVLEWFIVILVVAAFNEIVMRCAFMAIKRREFLGESFRFGHRVSAAESSNAPLRSASPLRNTATPEWSIAQLKLIGTAAHAVVRCERAASNLRIAH